MEVYKLARHLNHTPIIPENIFLKAPSAELRPHQKDTDSLPPYEILDPLVEDYIEHQMGIDELVLKYNLSRPFIETLIQKIHQAEYKRRQAPLGLKVTSKAFSVGRSFPIVQGWTRSSNL